LTSKTWKYSFYRGSGSWEKSEAIAFAGTIFDGAGILALFQEPSACLSSLDLRIMVIINVTGMLKSSIAALGMSYCPRHRLGFWNKNGHSQFLRLVSAEHAVGHALGFPATVNLKANVFLAASDIGGADKFGGAN
jgi:hypothetical protein